MLRAFYPWASVVAVSRGAADDLARTSGLPRERVEVVYNPVITPEVLARAREQPGHPWYAPRGPPVILGVGRLTRQKDFSSSSGRSPRSGGNAAARLIILGEGEDGPAGGADRRARGQDDVALPGFQDNAMAYMAGRPCSCSLRPGKDCRPC